MHPVFKTLACSNNNHVPFDIQAKIFSERTHNKPNEYHWQYNSSFSYLYLPWEQNFSKQSSNWGGNHLWSVILKMNRRILS